MVEDGILQLPGRPWWLISYDFMSPSYHVERPKIE